LASEIIHHFSRLYFYPYFSQVDFSSTRFGLIAGPTYSRIQNAHNPSSSRISFYGGALAIIPIGGDDMFYLQPQVEYLSAGKKGDGETVYANNYLSVPVYFKAYFSEAESEFFRQLGPRFGFLLSQKVENPSRSISFKINRNTQIIIRVNGFSISFFTSA
jgi:hypothetical protein